MEHLQAMQLYHEDGQHRYHDRLALSSAHLGDKGPQIQFSPREELPPSSIGILLLQATKMRRENDIEKVLGRRDAISPLGGGRSLPPHGRGELGKRLRRWQ